MSTGLKPRWLAPLLLLAAAVFLPQNAWALRCGNKLVTEGDTMGAVVAKCGEPTEVSRQSTLRPPVIWHNGYPLRVPGGDFDIPVEIWIYNLGPNKLMRRVRFESGVVVEITTLGYGYL
jgi:Protein of unknown function (DUF2845)